MARKREAAHETFTRLGAMPIDWTPAMALAHKQKWTGLDVLVKLPVDELRVRLADVEPKPTPTADALLAAGEVGAGAVDDTLRLEACRAEAKRLAANAKVNAWRERGVLKAAIDARTHKTRKATAARLAKTAAADSGGAQAAVDRSTGLRPPTGGIRVRSTSHDAVPMQADAASDEMALIEAEAAQLNAGRDSAVA